MKKINAKDWNRIETLRDLLEERKGAVVSAMEALAPLFAELNSTREELHGVLEDLANEAEAYFDDRSERWQEGDAGSAYTSWRESIEGARDALADDFEPPEAELSEVDSAVEAVNEISQEPNE